MNTSKLFLLGSCVAFQLVEANAREVKSRFGSVEMVNGKFTSKFSTSLIKPGPIAERLHDEMGSNIHECPLGIRRQYNAIVKPYSIREICASAKPTDAIMLDFQGELLPTFNDGVEEFSIVLGLFSGNMRKYWPTWLIDKITTSTAYQEDMMSPDARRRRDLQIYKFADTITQLFGTRVIVVQNVFTNKIFIPELNRAGEQLIIPDSNISLPFITVTADGDESYPNFKFFDRLYKIHDRRLQTYAPHWSYIVPDKDKCYADLEHEFGPHPTHLHPTSFAHLVTQFDSIMHKFDTQTFDDTFAKMYTKANSGQIIVQ